MEDKGKLSQPPYTSANEKTRKTGGGTLGGEREKRGEEGGVAGGNIVGGNPVEVTPMKVASLLAEGGMSRVGLRDRRQ